VKLLSRDDFREGVFARDNHRCVFCEKAAVDAHHIIERRLWPDGGYYMDNGASVCEEHHLACERTDISVEDVRHACGITKIIVPPHLYDDHVYDKWGNPVLPDGKRGRGELFHDESVQKVIKEHLKDFTPYVKYPRTFHLPSSPGIHDDDKVNSDLSTLLVGDVIITEKMDGENTSMYGDHIHARSLDSRGGEDRAWVKQFHSRIRHDIPTGWRVCGENLWAQHSIGYDSLRSYFYGFSIWDERNVCLSWDETLLYLDVLGITPVPVLYRGPFNEDVLREREKFHIKQWSNTEGFVIRPARAFTFAEFKKCVFKWVRAGHVQTTKHWRAGRAFTPNGIRKDVV